MQVTQEAENAILKMAVQFNGDDFIIIHLQHQIFNCSKWKSILIRCAKKQIMLLEHMCTPKLHTPFHFVFTAPDLVLEEIYNINYFLCWFCAWIFAQCRGGQCCWQLRGIWGLQFEGAIGGTVCPRNVGNTTYTHTVPRPKSIININNEPSWKARISIFFRVSCPINELFPDLFVQPNMRRLWIMSWDGCESNGATSEFAQRD
jgi:hypothetical protein